MKTFAHTRPVRDPDGTIVGQKPCPVRRVTVDTLGGMFGRDGKRRLVVGLDRCAALGSPEDIITFRPEGTRQMVSAKAKDLYREVLLWRSRGAQLERARERKAVLNRQREARKLRDAERRLTR